MSLRTEPLDADGVERVGGDAAGDEETREGGDFRALRRERRRARGDSWRRGEGKRNCVELELEALGGVSDETLAKFATVRGESAENDAKSDAAGGGATPRLEPIRDTRRAGRFLTSRIACRWTSKACIAWFGGRKASRAGSCGRKTGRVPRKRRWNACTSKF